MNRRYAASALAVSLMVAGMAPAAAQGVLDILTAPKTLIDRAIEARSANDIARDNEIVLKVNAIMAELGTIKASTEIYEQRLLVTGLFDDLKLYNRFRAKVRQVKGIKRLYWHVRHMTANQQADNKTRMIDWDEALVLDGKVGVKLISTRGVADVNFRVAADAFATIYLIGRARSKDEKLKAARTAKSIKGVRKLVDYVEVRP